MQTASVPAILLLCLLLSAVLRSRAEDLPPPLVVDPKAVSASLVPKDPEVMLGVPTFLSFIVTNNLDRDLEIPVGVPRRDLFTNATVMAVDASGQPLHAPKLQLNGNGMCGWERLAGKAKCVIELYIGDFAIITKPGVYTFTAKPVLPVKYADVGFAQPRGYETYIPVETSTNLTIIPADKEKIGELIETAGKALLAHPREFDGHALSILCGINDERVTPWFIRAAHTDNYDLQFWAMSVLGRHNSDEALKTLEFGLSVTNENIVAAACGGLQESSNPKAIEILLKHRHDANDNTRNEATRALWRVDKRRAIPILKQMLKDKSATVRTNATDILNYFRTEPAPVDTSKLRSADKFWRYIDVLEQWVSTGPLDAQLDRLRKLESDFHKRFPNDARYWKSRLFINDVEYRDDSLYAAMTRGSSYGVFPDTEIELKEIAETFDAPPEIRASARRRLEDRAALERQRNDLPPSDFLQQTEQTQPDKPSIISVEVIGFGLGEGGAEAANTW